MIQVREIDSGSKRTLLAHGFTCDGVDYWISTVLLYLADNYDDDLTLALGGNYETMIFECDAWDDFYCERYLTKQCAIDSHLKIIKLIESEQFEFDGIEFKFNK